MDLFADTNSVNLIEAFYEQNKPIFIEHYDHVAAPDLVRGWVHLNLPRDVAIVRIGNSYDTTIETLSLLEPHTELSRPKLKLPKLKFPRLKRPRLFKRS